MKLRTKYLLFVEGGVAAGILILSPAMYGMAAAELEDQAGNRLAEETALDYENPGRVTAFNRYWSVTQSGISGFSCDTAFTYVPADVAGSEAGL